MERENKRKLCKESIESRCGIVIEGIACRLMIDPDQELESYGGNL